MKRLVLLLLMLLSMHAFSQSWLTREENYFFVSTGVDVRNAIFGGTVNDAAYDGTYSIGYRNAGFSILAYYETFSAIRYESAGVNPGYVFRPGKRLVPVADISLSFIRRPWKVYPSLALNSRVEFHFARFFVYLRGESRWRTDYDFFNFQFTGASVLNSAFPIKMSSLFLAL